MLFSLIISGGEDVPVRSDYPEMLIVFVKTLQLTGFFHFHYKSFANQFFRCFEVASETDLSTSEKVPETVIHSVFKP